VTREDGMPRPSRSPPSNQPARAARRHERQTHRRRRVAATLAFTEVNWNAPQTVTVTGVDEKVADGMQTYVVHVAPIR